MTNGKASRTDSIVGRAIHAATTWPTRIPVAPIVACPGPLPTTSGVSA
jgi:hypothetical protein